MKIHARHRRENEYNDDDDDDDDKNSLRLETQKHHVQSKSKKLRKQRIQANTGPITTNFYYEIYPGCLSGGYILGSLPRAKTLEGQISTKQRCQEADPSGEEG